MNRYDEYSIFYYIIIIFFYIFLKEKCISKSYFKKKIGIFCIINYKCEFLINVNFYLYRNFIEKFYLSKLSEREVEVRSVENEELIRIFE